MSFKWRVVITTGLVIASRAASATEAHYDCSGGTRVAARFSAPDAANGEVALTFDGGYRIILPQAVSADGGRYARDGIEFWVKGRSATLTRDGASEACDAD